MTMLPRWINMRCTSATAALLVVAALAGLHRIPKGGNPVEQSSLRPPASGRSTIRPGLDRHESQRPPDLANELLADAARSDPAEALERARTLQGGERDEALAAVAVALAETSPADAAIVIEHEIAAGSLRDAARIRLTALWAERSPLEAAAYVEASPTGDLRGQLLDQLLAVWPDHQREQAIGWIEALPSGPMLAQATAALSHRLEHTDPTDSEAWFGAIASPALAGQLRQALAR